MFKKTLLGAVILMVVLVSGLSAGNYTIPSGYTLVKSVGNSALKVYHKNGIYVSVIDLSKANLNVGNVDEVSNGRFESHFINTWWSDVANWKTLGMYNGQFFNYSGSFPNGVTSLSYPLRSYWNPITTNNDGGYVRTLRVNSSGATTIHYGYSNDWFMNSAKELIVGLSPYRDMGYNYKKGRFYIGGIPYNSSTTNSYNRTMRYLLFFIGESKTQGNMLNELVRWNVMNRDIVMMDGSGSAQMKVDSLKKGGNRWLPNVITIEKKGFLTHENGSYFLILILGIY